MNSAFMDLGSTVETLYQVAIYKDYYRIFHGHFQPFILIFSIPFFIFKPIIATYIILIIQNILLLSPILIILRRYNFKYSIMYLLNPYIYYISFNSFNIDCLIIPFISYFLIFSNSHKVLLSLITSIIICLIKEPYSLVSIMCGFYLIIKLDKNFKNILFSTILILFSSLYFYFTVAIILPLFSPNLNLLSEYAYLGKNIKDIISKLHINIFIFIENLFDFNKLKFFIYILLFFSPIIIFFPLELMLISPLILILLASKNQNYYSIGHHYLMPLLPIFIFCIYKFTIKRPLIVLNLFIFFTFLINIILSPSPVSRLFISNKIDYYNYRSYILDSRSLFIRTKIDEIFYDRKANLTLSIQNNIFNPTLFTNAVPILFPDGIYEKKIYPFLYGNHSGKQLFADYILIDTKKQPYIYDKSCNYLYGQCQDTNFLEDYLKIIEYLKLNFEIIFSYDGFYIFKR